MTAALLIALISLATPAPALACKPAPVKACDTKDLIPLHALSFEKLAEKVTAFQKELTAFLLKAPSDKGRSSCFNSNFAVYFVAQARDSAPKRNGKICSELIQKIKNRTESLVNADSAEWKAVKGKEDQAALSIQAKEVRSALEEFLHHH
jgi:hypothetical protein